MVVYIYSIVFDSFPLSTKIVLEGIGLIACFKYLFNPRYRLYKEYRSIIRIIVAIVAWDVITSLINGQSEFHLIRDLLPVLGSIFGAQLLFIVSKKNLKSTDEFLLLLVLTIFAESILTIAMKLVPPLYSLVDAFLVFDFGTDNITDIFDIARFFGIGNAHYFGVMPSCLLGVLTAVYLINKSESALLKVLLIASWVIISISSFFVARWAITAIGLSFVFFILNQRKQNLFKSIGILVGLFIVVWVAYTVTMSNIDSDLQKWAFSFMTDKSSDDRSADNVIDWWLNTHFDLKTFLIGDAIYTDPRGGYYMHVDIGFFREIFYGGIIGLGLNLWGHVMILKMMYKYNRNRSFKLFLYFLMFGYFAILAKGDANMMTFFILFLVYYTGGIFARVPERRTVITSQPVFATKTNEQTT